MLHLHLVEARLDQFDRVFDGADIDLRRGQVFQAGVEREVAEEIGLMAMQMGAKQVEGRVEVVADEDYEEPVDPDEVVAVMQELIKDGDPKNFKADGTPKAAVVNKIVGRTVPTDERLAAWETALNS